MDKKIFSILIIFFVFLSIIGASNNADATTDPTTLIKITLLNQNPSPASSGETADLTFSVENLGSAAADNVELELVSAYPFTVIDNALQNAGTLYGYQAGESHKTLTYRLKVDKDVVSGTYDLKIRYKYGASAWTEKTVPVEVSSKTYAQLIYIDKSTLLPGKETDITFKITNTGNSPLQNMVFSWTEADSVILPVHSDNSRYIKYLDTGASTDLVYTVIADVNANPGLYRIDMNLNYESADNSTEKAINSKAGIFIGGETDFDVAFSQSSQGQTSLSVSNIGNTPAMSVSVRVPLQPNYRISGTDTAIIGNLDKGDYTLVSFQISSDARNNTFANNTQRNNPGNFQRNSSLTQRADSGLRVLIDYTDTTGERRTVEKTVSIQFRDATSLTGVAGASKQTGFIGSTAFYILLGIVLIVGFIIYRKRAGIFGNKKK